MTDPDTPKADPKPRTPRKPRTTPTTKAPTTPPDTPTEQPADQPKPRTTQARTTRKTTTDGEPSPSAPKRPRTNTRSGNTPGRGRRVASGEVQADERIRQERAYQLKLRGATFQQIAESPHPEDPGRKLYASAGAARNAWLTARDRHSGGADTAEERELFRHRNEAIFRAIMPQCLNSKDSGQLWAIDRYVKLFAEHSKMMGLPIPVKQEIQVITESAIDAAIREGLEEMARAEEELAELMAGIDDAGVEVGP